MKIKKALHCCTESILRIKPVIWNCNSNIIKHNGMPSMQEQQKEKQAAAAAATHWLHMWPVAEAYMSSNKNLVSWLWWWGYSIDIPQKDVDFQTNGNFQRQQQPPLVLYSVHSLYKSNADFFFSSSSELSNIGCPQ